jgi:hypothetical protein
LLEERIIFEDSSTKSALERLESRDISEISSPKTIDSTDEFCS